METADQSLQGMLSQLQRCDLSTSTRFCLQLEPYSALFISINRERRWRERHWKNTIFVGFINTSPYGCYVMLTSSRCTAPPPAASWRAAISYCLLLCSSAIDVHNYVNTSLSFNSLVRLNAMTSYSLWSWGPELTFQALSFLFIFTNCNVSCD